MNTNSFLFGLASMFLAFSLPTTGHAVTAKVFAIEIPNGDEINPKRNHIGVRFEQGWIAADNGRLRNIFSSAESAAFRISAKITQGGTSTPIEVINSINRPRGSMRRPLSGGQYLFNDIPGDVSLLELKVSLSVSNQDVVGKALIALEGTQANLPTQVLTSPWVGYARMVSSLSNAFFGTNEESTPISTAPYQLRIPTKATYIIMVASNREDDPNVASLRASDFSFSNNVLQYKGANSASAVDVRDWTYLVFSLKPVSFDTVEDRIMYDGAPPWATLIKSQLRVIPVVDNRDQILTLSKNLLVTLTNLEEYLVADKSLTAYDRHVALYYYGKQGIDRIKNNCTAKKIPNCPTDEVAQYVSSIAPRSGMTQYELATAATAMNLKSQVTSIASSSATTSNVVLNAASNISLNSWLVLVERGRVAAGKEVAAENVLQSMAEDAQTAPHMYSIDLETIQAASNGARAEPWGNRIIDVQ